MIQYQPREARPRSVWVKCPGEGCQDYHEIRAEDYHRPEAWYCRGCAEPAELADYDNRPRVEAYHR